MKASGRLCQSQRHNQSQPVTRARPSAQNTGTAAIHLQFDANNSLDIAWQKVAFATAEVGEMDQIVTVAVEAAPIYDSPNGIVTAVAKCNVDAIGQ